MEFAIGDLFPELTPQDLTGPSDLHISSIYFTSPKRYLFKKAHVIHEAWHELDIESGSIILDSHHKDKNPYQVIDLLGCNEFATGEWKSPPKVTSVSGGYPSLKLWTKILSWHMTQYIGLLDDGMPEVLNVAKMSKF